MIERLLEKRLLERVAADGDAARELLEEASRHRNRSEYELRFFDAEEVLRDLGHARAIVAAVGDAL